jgi:DNA repair protein RadA/Sms
VLERTLLAGEVSLSGELRRVPRLDLRVREARQLGFVRAAVPASQAAEAQIGGIEILPVAHVREALDCVLGPRAAGEPMPSPAKS